MPNKILDELVAKGVASDVIGDVAMLIAEIEHLRRDTECLRIRRERDAERKRALRVCGNPRTSEDVRGQHRRLKKERKKERKKDLPLIDVPIGTSIRGRERQTKLPLPSDWNPVVTIEDQPILDDFKDHARQNARRCADWDAAWRRWQRSPYRKTNGRQTNGKGHRETPAEQGKRLADQWRQREQELGSELLRTPDNARSAGGHR